MSYLGKTTDRVSRNTYSYTATSGQTVFSATYTPGNVDVFQNGVKLLNGTDFTATNGTSVTLAVGAVVNDIVEIVGYTAADLVNAYTKTEVDTNFRRSDLTFRNYIINGDFRIWQRGTSQASAGYGSDDRWNNDNVGSTKTHSMQAFTPGQTDVPGNPLYFSRTVVTSVAGAGNYVIKAQPIEDVTKSSGKTFTLSFYAKADGNKNIAVEFKQVFGVGGSAQISNINTTTFALSTVWQKFIVTTTFPSISGKTVGTNNYFTFNIWFEAGSSFNSRTNSLGQQSGTFDIAMVQLEEGTKATQFEYRPDQVELALCQRYYQCAISSHAAVSERAYHERAVVAGTYVFTTKPIYFPPMRTVPTLTYYAGANRTSGTQVVVNNTATSGWASYGSGLASTPNGFIMLYKTVTAAVSDIIAFDYELSAEL